MLRLAVLSTICALVLCAGLAWGADTIRAAETAGPEAALHSGAPAKPAHQQTLPECSDLAISLDRKTTISGYFSYFVLENNGDTALRNVQVEFYVVGYLNGRAEVFKNYSNAIQLFPDANNTTGIVTVNIPVIEPNSSHHTSSPGSSYPSRPTSRLSSYEMVEFNAVARVFSSSTYETALCETPAFVGRRWSNANYYPIVTAGAALDSYEAAVGEAVTFKFTFFSSTHTYSRTSNYVEACLNFHFEDGLQPTLTPRAGSTPGVIFYDGPNGAYYGPDDVPTTTDTIRYGQKKTSGDFYARSTRMEYEYDGQDDDYGVALKRPQCSDAAGEYQGGLLHFGSLRRGGSLNTHFPTGWFANTPPGKRLYFTAEVPATVQANGSTCATVTARVLPGETTPKRASDTARLCVRRTPPEAVAPVLLEEGRADLLTLQRCANGAQFGCAGKADGDLTLNVVSAEDAHHAISLGSGERAYDVAVGGNAAVNAGSARRIFSPEEVVVHVPDVAPVNLLIATKTRHLRRNDQTPNYPVSKTVWYTGHDIKDIPDTGSNADPNDFGLRAGVAAKYRFPGIDYNKYYLSICRQANAGGACETGAPDNNPGNMRALLGETWTTTLFDIKASQPTTPGAGYDRTSLDADGLVWEFSALGTYRADLVVEGRPTSGTKKAVGAYTFHVGPVTELSVSDAPSLPSGVTLGPGQTALVVQARNHYREDNSPQGTRVKVTLPEGASVAAATPTAGAYDTVNNVWELGRGLPHDDHAVTTNRATLTLALTGAAAGATGSAQIYHPECFSSSGAAIAFDDLQRHPDAVSLADVKNREACLWELNPDGTRKQSGGNDIATGNAYGSYGVCIRDHWFDVNPGNATVNVFGMTANVFDTAANIYTTVPIATKAACDAEATRTSKAHSWHAGNVLDYRPANNVATLTQKTDPSAFLLTADAIDEQTARLAWAGHAGADGYRIYRVVGGELDGLSRVAEVPAGATSYHDRTLSDGETRYYRVAARRNGQDVAVTNAATATARQVAPLPARNVGEALGVKPATVSNLAAVRSGLNAAHVNLFWNPASDASFYQVQYREASTQPAGEWTTAVSALFFPKYQFTGAKSGARYEFRVRAMNGDGSQLVPGAWAESGVVFKAVYGNPRAYAYTLTSGSNFGKRDTTKQFELHVNNASPQGAWSNDTTLWVADSGADKMYAYTLTAGSDFGKRDTTKEFGLHADNASPQGIWSNDTILWVADSGADKVYAYKLTSGNDFGKRDTTKEFETDDGHGHGHEGSQTPRGIWSDGTTLWVADYSDRTVHAYKLTPGNDFGEHDESKEIDLHTDNANPEGLWSDGTTLWVADPSDDKVYAYTLDTNVRDTTKEFLLAAGNSNARGIWSNDTTLWVADSTIPLQVEPPPPGRVNDVRTPSSGASRVVTWAHAPYATHYDVESTSDGGTTWKREASDYAIASSNFNVDSFRVSYTLTVDNANGAYHVRVRGKNHTADATPVLRVGPWTDDLPPSGGVSGASAASGAAAATQLPDAPDAVGSVSVTHHGDSLSASWTAAARAGAYQVAYSGDNGATWTTAADAHGSTSITISGVDPGATYLVSVRAYNDGRGQRLDRLGAGQPARGRQLDRHGAGRPAPGQRRIARPRPSDTFQRS